MRGCYMVWMGIQGIRDVLTGIAGVVKRKMIWIKVVADSTWQVSRVVQVLYIQGAVSKDQSVL